MKTIEETFKAEKVLLEKFFKNRISYNIKKSYVNEAVDYGFSAVFDEFR